MTDKKENEIKEQLDKLALSIAKSASLDTTLFPDKLDAFKALTAYHLGIAKVKKKNGEDDETTPKGETFNDYRKSIETGG